MISKKAKDCIKEGFRKGKVVCLTGEGISPVYPKIDGLTGLFKESPGQSIALACDFYSLLLEARPNHAHLALAILEKTGLLASIITQNIDNLHQEAGSRLLIELQGNAFRIRCDHCANVITLEKPRITEMIHLLKYNLGLQLKLLKILSRYFPRCNKCKGRYRLDIVLSGQAIPEDELSKAYAQLDGCNLLLIVGTSLSAQPVATLPLYAKDKGAKIIEINQDQKAVSNLCDYKIIGKPADVLPEIVQMCSK